MNYIISETLPEKDYELLDSGENQKLERFGEFVTSRPDPQALWPKRLTADLWNLAHATFGGDGRGVWNCSSELKDRWEITLGGLSFWIKPSTFKHVGVFPEHLSNWKWIEESINSSKLEQVRVLNLFGYTGGATLAAAKAGAEVVHVDGSKVAITSAKNNAELSGLGDKPIRWILDDAAAFVRREVKRGKFYEGIVLDPPAFGHGPDGELWKIEEHLIPLVEQCKQIVSENALFFIINGYASGYSAIAYKQILESVFKDQGKIEMGELTIKESGERPRNLPAGIFARWSNNR